MKGSGFIQFPPQRPFQSPLQVQPPTVVVRIRYSPFRAGFLPSGISTKQTPRDLDQTLRVLTPKNVSFGAPGTPCVRAYQNGYQNGYRPPQQQMYSTPMAPQGQAHAAARALPGALVPTNRPPQQMQQQMQQPRAMPIQQQYHQPKAPTPAPAASAPPPAPSADVDADGFTTKKSKSQAKRDRKKLRDS
eukprot:1187554-Prorocentrum_minimum.AAC.6